MSTAGRAYDLLRAYVNGAYDRVFDPRGGTRADPMRSELERELAETLPPVQRTPVNEAAPRPMDQDEARRILGVRPDAPFGEVRRERERLVSRCDPARFPAGSDERRRAAALRTQVEAAYLVLRDAAEATDRRFGSLELD